MEKTINNLRDELKAVQKKLEYVDEVIVERDMLAIRLENYVHVDELEKLRERVNEGNGMKLEVDRLNIKVTQLAEQYRSEVKKHQETINRLNETG
jgi:hypothetical protein